MIGQQGGDKKVSSGTVPHRGRRALVRGALSVPALLTLPMVGAFAASNMNCLAKSKRDTDVPSVSTDEKDNYQRIQLLVAQKVDSPTLYYVSQSAVSAAAAALKVSDATEIGADKYRLFDIGSNTMGAVDVVIDEGYTLAPSGQFAVLTFVDGLGGLQLRGVGKSPYYAMTDSCMTSFAG
ncbi:MAG: hypothetical protein ABIX12_03860 [Rubrivivax sp.]